MRDAMKVLVVDDEPSICWGFQRLLGDEGYEVMVASAVEAGLVLAANHSFALVLLDVRLPGEDGLTALPKFRAATNDAPIVVMTAFGDLETAVKAIHQGAIDYLTKPFSLDQAGATCLRAMARSESMATTPSKTQGFDSAGPELIGSSPAMQAVFRQIAMVADSSLSVLITGETGTGKEVVANAIHKHSKRADKPYLTVAPVAFNESLFESELFGHVRGAFTGATEDRRGLFDLASGGSILLDEIGDLPLSSQVKLLRVIEQQQYTPVGDIRPRACDVRVITATHRDLYQEVAAGRFREDLMYRLSAVRIYLPPLRERIDDIPLLCEYFLRRIGHPFASNAISETVAKKLSERPWFGNVRELRHAIEHAAIYARNRAIDISDFPAPQPSLQSLGAANSLANAVQAWTEEQVMLDGDQLPPIYDRFLAATEPTMLRIVLQAHAGNRAAAAERLGMHRATLRERLRKYGIDDPGSASL